MNAYRLMSDNDEFIVIAPHEFAARRILAEDTGDEEWMDREETVCQDPLKGEIIQLG